MHEGEYDYLTYDVFSEKLFNLMFRNEILIKIEF